MMTNVLVDPNRVERVCRRAIDRGVMTRDLFRLWKLSHVSESFTHRDALALEHAEVALEADNVVPFRACQSRCA